MQTELLDYLKYIRDRVASTTYHRKSWQIETFIKYLDEKKLSHAAVKQSDVEAFLIMLDCTQRYRQAFCGVIREFYDYLQLRKPDLAPTQNPAAAIRFNSNKSVTLPKVPSQAAMDELFAKFEGLDDEFPLRNRLIVELAYGSGLRRMELVRLNIEDINIGESLIHVTGKGDKQRLVPLTEKAKEAACTYLLKRRATRGPLLLSRFRKRLSLNGVYVILRYSAGIRPHLLRHACATHLLRNGCDLRVIQDLLGHQRLDTTRIYTAVNKASLRDVIMLSHPRSYTTSTNKKQKIEQRT
jgi:site-specific recombinase XerD